MSYIFIIVKCLILFVCLSPLPFQCNQYRYPIKNINFCHRNLCAFKGKISNSLPHEIFSVDTLLRDRYISPLRKNLEGFYFTLFTISQNMVSPNLYKIHSPALLKKKKKVSEHLHFEQPGLGKAFLPTVRGLDLEDI